MFTAPNAQAYGGASAAENPFDYLAQAQNRLGQRNYREDLARTQQSEAEMARIEALNNALSQAGDWFASSPVAGATPNPTGRIDDISQHMISAAGGPDMNFARFQDELQEQMAQGRAAAPMVDNFATMAGGVSDLARAGQVYPGGLDVGGMTVGDFSRQTSWGMTPDQAMRHASSGEGDAGPETYQWTVSYPVGDSGEYSRYVVDIPIGIPREQADQYAFSSMGGLRPSSSGGISGQRSRSYMPINTGNPSITSAQQTLQRAGNQILDERPVDGNLHVEMIDPTGEIRNVVIDSEGSIHNQ